MKYVDRYSILGYGLLSVIFLSIILPETFYVGIIAFTGGSIWLLIYFTAMNYPTEQTQEGTGK